MGTDIHCWVETNYNGGGWREFGGQIRPGRDYRMFEVMAGVRGDDALFPQRGLPDDLSYSVKFGQDAAFVLIEEGIKGYGFNEDGEPAVSLERAKEWRNPIIEKDGKPHHVLDPDTHSHSWLTLPELHECFTEYEKRWPEMKGVGGKYKAIAAIMASLENGDEKYQTRLVFWFDC